MCGIAGQLALRPDVTVDRGEVERMTHAMVHRGPDDHGFFFDDADRVALGMRRLAVIDLVTGRQPVFNEDGAVACVFNGEIYNFPELRAELERKGHEFRTHTDTEVIVHLYEEEGVDCVRRLRGMFAFALWDSRAERLLVARDRLGKKPLYYEEFAGRLSFASEIGALPPRRREVDLAALDLYLTHSYVPAPFSIHGTIRKLPPAHVLVSEHGRIRVERYWSVLVAPVWEASREELLRRFRDELEEAVRIRLISDVPLGCFLSGGVDSSTVVAIMSGLGAKPVRTFSIGFSSQRYDELEYARAVAERFGTEHHEFVVEPDAVAVLPEIARHFGEPYGDSSALPVWYVSKLAREHVTVALNGDGGDELFAGYAWYRTAERLDRLARLLPRIVAERFAQASGDGSGRVARLVRRLAMEPAERFASLRRFLEPEERRRLYSPAFLAGRGGEADAYLSRAYAGNGDADAVARMLRVDIETYLPEDLLVKVDRMTMAHSLEGRSPLLDHELVEFCARIPSHFKTAGGGSKLLMRDAVRELFPSGFLDRPKMGFSIPVAEWLRSDLAGELAQRVAAGPLVESGWFSPVGLRAVIEEHQSRRRDRSATLWNLLMLAQWMEVSGGAG
jgi:asparagine synthase (glutamine-hydrolysing)